MSTFALSALRARAQQEADMVNTEFVSPAEWANYINGSYTELYGAIVQAFGNDYYSASPYSFTTDGTNYLFALPTSPAVFKLLGVELQAQSSQWVTLRPFTLAQRNQFGFSSIPMAGQVVRLWYVPALTALSADGDLTVDIANGWEEFIVIDAAMKALGKEESDTSVLNGRKQAILARIASEAENRDAGSPTRIVDVYSNAGPGMQYRLNGANLWLIGGSMPAWPVADGMGWM